jgi:hypothetical protein
MTPELEAEFRRDRGAGGPSLMGCRAAKAAASVL